MGRQYQPASHLASRPGAMAPPETRLVGKPGGQVLGVANSSFLGGPGGAGFEGGVGDGHHGRWLKQLFCKILPPSSSAFPML
jgi:hypothetical protein